MVLGLEQFAETGAHPRPQVVPIGIQGGPQSALEPLDGKRGIGRDVSGERQGGVEEFFMGYDAGYQSDPFGFAAVDHPSGEQQLGGGPARVGPQRDAAPLGDFQQTTAGLVGVFSLPDGWGVGGRYLYGFLSPTVVLMSLAAFVLFRAVPHVMSLARWVPRSAALTFGIFLIHPLVLFPLQSWWSLPSSVAPLLLATSIHLIITISASAALTLVLGRIPYLRATVG
jgi:hypothetical protein